jgi:hypothetical protein
MAKRDRLLPLAEIHPASVPDAPSERSVSFIREAMDAKPACSDTADASPPSVSGVIARTGARSVATVSMRLRLVGHYGCTRKGERGEYGSGGERQAES